MRNFGNFMVKQVAGTKNVLKEFFVGVNKDSETFLEEYFVSWTTKN